MSAYFICLREGPVRDAEALAEYQRKTRESKGDFKLKPLVIYGATEALEGDAPEGTILLEFPTMEEANAWYNSPGYQAALPYRLKAGNYRAFIADGIASAAALTGS